MATLTIRKLDDGVYERLRAQAARNERSIEAEARLILDRMTVGEDLTRRARFDELMGRLWERQANTPVDPDAPDSVALIRAVRDEE